MGNLEDRVIERDGEWFMVPTGVPLAEVYRRLESGEIPYRVANTLALEPADLIAALAVAGLGPAESDLGPPLVQCTPSRPKLVAAAGEEALARLIPESNRTARRTLSAGLLQVLDAWDASHQAAQEADDLGERRFSAYWHGIAHRREPDPGNASYWFRRVGRHPVFAELADSAACLLDSTAPELTDHLCPKRAWDPFAFITYCTGRPDADLARRLQRLEMLLLLEATAAETLPAD